MKKRRDWKNEIDAISKEKNIEILEYPNCSKDYVKFIIDSVEYKQRADRFIKQVDVKGISLKKIIQANKLSQEEVLTRILSVKSNSTYVSGVEDYKKNSTSNILFKCSLCSKEYKRSLSNFLKNSRCPFCERLKNRVYTKTTEKFKEDVLKEFGDEYTVLGDYKGARIKIKLKHNTCNTIFYAPAGRFLREKGFKCPTCFAYMSRGEMFIKSYLKKKNIEFEQQFYFDDLKLENKLLFDFYIKDMNLLIEFDGEQHFREIEYFTRTAPFEKVIEADILKDNYCKNNKIRLLRIPFWELYNVERILEVLFENKNKDITFISNILEKENIYIDKKYFEKFKNKKI